MTQMAIRGVVPPSFPQSVARASLENKIVLLMLACHSTQVLSYWLEMGSMGQIVGACGAMMAIGLSLLSARAMFVLLLGLCYIPLAGPVLASLRAYVLVYVVLLARLCVSPSVYALLGGKSPGSRAMRRWYATWAAFALLTGAFYVLTADTPFGVSCAWNMTRGLGTAFLACMLATLALEHTEGDSVLSFAIVTYTLLGALLFRQAGVLAEAAGAIIGSEGRLGDIGGGDPNAVAMMVNVGIGLCLGVLVQSRSWLLRLYALAAILLAATVVVMTGSRAALIAGAAMVAAALLMNAPRLTAVPKRIIVLGGLLVLALVVVAPSAQESLLPRWQHSVEAFEAGDYQSATAGRFLILQDYWQRTVAGHFLGSGFNYDTLMRVGVAHNTWLQVLSDLGILGFALFLAITLPMFKLVLRSLHVIGTTRSPQDRGLVALRTGLAIAVTGLLLETSTLTSIFEIPFWWCAGCAVAFDYRNRNARFENQASSSPVFPAPLR